MPDISFTLNQSQSQKQTQELRMTQQQQQSLAVLQMDTLKLLETVRQAVVENPALEYEDWGREKCETDLNAEATGNLEKDLTAEQRYQDNSARLVEYDESLADGIAHDPSTSVYDNYAGDSISLSNDPDAEARRQHRFDSITAPAGIQEQLVTFIHDSLPEDSPLARLCVQVMEHIDDWGYLRLESSWTVQEAADYDHLKVRNDPDEMDAALAREMEVSLDELRKAIKVIQSLEPAGLAAHDFRECLLLQLERAGEKGSIAWDIVDTCLDDFLKNKLPEIAGKVDADLSEVQEAADRIKQLDPRPGRIFADTEAHVVMAEATIRRTPEGEWTFKMNGDSLPKVVISQSFLELRENDQDPATKAFVRTKLADAKKLIFDLNFRMTTLEKITAAIVTLQYDYFEYDETHLRPLVLAEVAEVVGYSESTVSRAIDGKYLDTPYGIREYKFFFKAAGYSDASSGDSVTNVAIRSKLKMLVAQEDPRKPLSDQKLADKLNEMGLKVARRTIEKYRTLDNIPAASLRRRH